MGQGKRSRLFRVTRGGNNLMIDSIFTKNLDDPSTVRRQHIVHPEMARLVRDFESIKEWSDERMHREQYPKFQSYYKSDVVALVDACEMAPHLFGRQRLATRFGPINFKASRCGRQYEKSEGHRTAAIHNISQQARHRLGRRFHDSNMQNYFKVQAFFVSDSQKVGYVLHRGPTSQNRSYFVGSVFPSQHHRLCIFPQISTLPPSLTRKGYMHHEDKSEILDCIVSPDVNNIKPSTDACMLECAVFIPVLRPRCDVT